MKRKVLCADDDPDDKELICEALSLIDPEIEVLHADNGLQAINTLDELKKNNELPCLVIVDINMPLLDGKEMVLRLKADPAFDNVPIAILTTSLDPADSKLFQSLRVEVFFKPHRMEEFKSIAERFLVLCDDN
jgi:CheY-like chemotaxis protein